jgi:hypothetical protein
MIRSGHFFYDLRKILASPKLLLGILGVAGILTFLVDFQCVYGFVLLLAAIFTVRVLVGRRCPQCDHPLKEVGAEKDQKDVFTLYVNWRCPRDGYEEKETIKGGSGLFGSG